MTLVRMIVLLALTVTAFAGCRTRNGTITNGVEPESLGLSEPLFVGCVPSEGQCRDYCSNNSGIGQRNATLCDEGLGLLACYCPGEVRPTTKAPPASTHNFLGCVSSASDCRYSCKNRRIITFQGSDQCQTREFACFCER